MNDKPLERRMPWKDPEFWNWLPFMLGATQGPTKWNVARFLEALIIAGGSVMGTMYLNQELLKNEMAHMNRALVIVQEDVKEDVSEVKDQVKELRALIFQQARMQAHIAGATP